MRPRPRLSCARAAVPLAVLVVLALHATPAAARARRAAAPAPADPTADRRAAEQLVASPPGGARDARLGAWARTARFDDVLWVLRHEPAELGHAELALVEAALARVPAGRVDLRRRIEARRLLLDPRLALKAGRDAAELEYLRPRASVWRVAALLPDHGDYAGYAATVRAGLDAGLAWRRPPEALAIELEPHGTGDGDAAQAAAWLDTVSRSCAVVVGELLSVPTLALATGARMLGVPLVSPTATDESIGRVGPAVFQVGPASSLRGETLARAVLRARPRKLAVLTSSAVAKSPFVTAFVAVAESLGATLVRRDVYVPGTTDFRVTSRGLRAFGAEVLFWDGETREGDALVRQLAADGVSVRICGGSALAPDQFHAATRVLLDGVTYVGDDWRLPPLQQAELDSLGLAKSERPGPLWVRGFLAGRRIAAAVDAGARTPAELAGRLRHRDRALRDLGFLDCGLDGATLPVFSIAKGRPVEARPE